MRAGEEQMCREPTVRCQTAASRIVFAALPHSACFTWTRRALKDNEMDSESLSEEEVDAVPAARCEVAEVDCEADVDVHPEGRGILSRICQSGWRGV